MERVQVDYATWALAHVQRSEPKEDVVVHYTLPHDNTLSVSNKFAIELSRVLRRQRADLLLSSAWSWMKDMGVLNEKPASLIVKRPGTGSDQQYKFQTQLQSLNSWDLRAGLRFPKAFLPIFPGGWVELAQREGFTLPKD